MISDPNVFRAAKLLIDQHGDAAAIHAAQRAYQLADEGNMGAIAAWWQILEAIDELTRGRRKGEAVN
jgi:hypothetical protein